MKSLKNIVLVLIVLTCVNLMADTIILKSGSECKGKITGYDKDNIYLQMNDSKLILVDKALIETINSEKYTTPLINSTKSSYPRNYSKYHKPDNLENYLKPDATKELQSIESEELDTTTILNFSDSYSKGIRDAKRWHNANRWLLGGFATGLFLPVLGPPMISLSVSETYPDAVPANSEPNGYLQGYKKQTKIANRSSALGGGILGTLVTGIVIYFVMDK